VSRPHPAGPRHGDLLVERAAPTVGADADMLDPMIWPRGAERDEAGVLRIGSVALTDVVAEYGTPVYVMDFEDLRARVDEYRDAFAQTGEVEVYYAAKAFLASAVVRTLIEERLSIDVCTGGELALALQSGMPPERILFHGNNKSTAELVMALEAGVGRIVIDSFTEIRRLSQLADQLNVTPSVLVRVTLGVEAHTHEFIATAHEDQKFGFSLASGSAMAAVAEVHANPHLHLMGVHSHIGSQIFVASGFEVAAHRAVGLLAKIRDELGVELPELNLGGGLGIKYVATDTPPQVEQIAGELHDLVARECAAYGLAVPRLAVEPGRAIVGPTTVTVYEVGTIKHRSLEAGGARTYVSVDGGMSDNIRTALYDADYTVVRANRVTDAPPMLCRVVGKHCESGDIVIRDAWLPQDLVEGDLLAVAATGAYNRSMASNYNLVTRPPVVGVAAGQLFTVLRRETMADLFATDAGLT
jgi:diaminopimelate decarboxylase